MSRVSMQEFSAGLPVTKINPKEPRKPEGFGEDTGSTLGRVLRDAPSDVAETFRGMYGVLEDGKDAIVEAGTREGLSVTQRIAGGLVAPFSAVVNAAGEGVIGGAKLFTTDEFEKAVGDKVAEVGQAALTSEKGQNLRAWYDGLDEQTKYTLSGILAPTANVMTAGVGGAVAAPAVRATGRGIRGLTSRLPNLSRSTPSRTAEEAAQNVVLTANAAEEAGGSAVGDTVRGIGQQFRTFLNRTAREAQDTAAESRRIANMPEEKATLIRAGADERVVNVFERSTPEEVPIYKELVEQAKKAEGLPEDPSQLPKVIAGREFMKPVEHLITTRKGVGEELRKVRNGLSTTKNIDTNPAFRSFHEHLKTEYGVRFDKDGQIEIGTGTLAKGDIPKIQELYDQLSGTKLNSQKELDDWLQRSLKEFDLVQQREKTFSEEVSRIAEFARGEVGKLMPENYNQLRTEYAILSQPITQVVKLLGYKGKLDDLTAKDLKSGEVALRVLGNAADRPQSVIDDVLETANEFGYQSNVDINRIIYVTDQLEDLYDITPTRGFSGSAARGLNQSGAGAVSDAATGNVMGLFDRAMTSRASQKEIQEAFEAYINSLDGSRPNPAAAAAASQVDDAVEETAEEVADDLVAPTAKEANAAQKLKDAGQEQAYGAVAGVQLDENGQITFNPFAAALGIGAVGAVRRFADIRVTPETVAKNMDDTDLDKISRYLDNPDDFVTQIETGPLLRAVGISDNVDDAVRVRFLKEVTDEYAKLSN